MPPQQAHRRPQDGFTLMELLVVVVIITVSFTALVSISFSFSNTEDRLQEEALKLKNRLQFAHEQAVIRSEQYGVQFSETGYRFLHLDQNSWLVIDRDRLLKARQLEDNIVLELTLEGLEVALESTNDDLTPVDDEEPIRPQVYLLSSAETSPEFSVLLRVIGEDPSYEVLGNINGQYEIRHEDDAF